MDRQQINNSIVKYLEQYGPERIGIFGSYARNENIRGSDIDILVRFKETISLFDLVRIHRELSSILVKDIDLITESSLKNKALQESIYKDLQIIYE